MTRPRERTTAQQDGNGSGQARVGPPPSLATVRKQRAQQSTRSILMQAGFVAAAVAVVMLSVALRRPALSEHRMYKDALRTLQSDGLEASDDNIRFALQLIDAATQGYSEAGFRTVDPRGWPRECGSSSRESSRPECQRRPPVVSVKQDHDGKSVSLLELDASDRANVWLIDNFMSEEEAALVRDELDKLNFTVSPTNHQDSQNWRSSSSAVAPKESLVFQQLMRRSAALCGVPVSFVEDPQVVRYQPGESYQPHLDSSGPDHRHWTLLLYLNDPVGGGATAFPLLGIKVLPAPGVAIFWENLRPGPLQIAGTEDVPLIRNYYTLHDGQAPTASESKYAVNLWVRNSEYKA